MGRFKNVTLGEHYMQDFGMALESKDIGLPSVQTKYVSIPLADGDLDLTTVLSNRIHYGNRNIRMNFNSVTDYPGKKMSNVANQLHGQRVHIIFDDDLYYYYDGRLDMSDFKENRKGGEYVIDANCKPFKYTVQTSAEDWLWDTFDFENGYINELMNIVVTTSKEIELIADEQLSYASITTDAQVTVTYDNKSVVCAAGTTTLYDFEFQPGINKILITGNATITITYRGARL